MIVPGGGNLGEFKYRGEPRRWGRPLAVRAPFIGGCNFLGSL